MAINEIKGSVLHIVPPEEAINYKWEKNSKELPSNLQIISIDDFNSLPTTFRKESFCDDNIDIGSVLVKEPYTKKYVDVAKSEEFFFTSKFNVISTIASYLGATRMSIKTKVESIRKRTLTADCKVDYSKVTGELSIKRDKEEELAALYDREKHLHSPLKSEDKKYEERRRTGYEKAKHYIQEHGLEHDEDIKYLMALRDPDHPYPQTKDTYTFSLSKAVNDSLDIAFKLKVLPGVFKLDANVQQATESVYKVQVTMELEFNY